MPSGYLRFKPIYAALAVSLLTPICAQAGETGNLYANLGVSQISADLDLSDLSVQGNIVDLGQQSAKINMVTGRLGYRFAKFIAIEGEAGFGLGGDSFDRAVPVNVSGVGMINVDTVVDLDVTNYAIIFARGILPISDNFEIFARGGYGTATAEAGVVGSFAGLSASASQSESVDDFAYGVGAQFNLNERHGVRLDYASVGGDFEVISLSYAINF